MSQNFYSNRSHSSYQDASTHESNASEKPELDFYNKITDIESDPSELVFNLDISNQPEGKTEVRINVPAVFPKSWQKQFSSISTSDASETCSENNVIFSNRGYSQYTKKNLPGLVARRVIRILKKWNFGALAEWEYKLFKDFLKTYPATKTFAAYSKFVESNVRFGKILTDAVVWFLSVEGSCDFDDYLNNSRLNVKNQSVLREEKNFFYLSFRKIREGLDYAFISYADAFIFYDNDCTEFEDCVEKKVMKSSCVFCEDDKFF